MPNSGIIVYPTDFSDVSLQSLDTARQLAEALDAELHFIYVVEEPHIYTALEMGVIPLPSEDELIKGASARFKQMLEAHSLPADSVTKVITGRSAKGIVAYAKKVGARMIVMTTHGYSGVEHILLGSTTEAVIRSAECPVLSVRAIEE